MAEYRFNFKLTRNNSPSNNNDNNNTISLDEKPRNSNPQLGIKIQSVLTKRELY